MSARRLFANTLIAVLLQCLVLTTLFMYASYRRALTLPAATLAPCVSVTDPTRQADCANLALHAHLTAGPQLALLFVVMLVAALLPAWLAARAAGNQALAQALLIGITSAAFLFGFMEPGRMPALAALFGSILAGLIVARCGHDRNTRPKPSA